MAEEEESGSSSIGMAFGRGGGGGREAQKTRRWMRGVYLLELGLESERERERGAFIALRWFAFDFSASLPPWVGLLSGFPRQGRAAGCNAVVAVQCCLFHPLPSCLLAHLATQIHR